MTAARRSEQKVPLWGRLKKPLKELDHSLRTFGKRIKGCWRKNSYIRMTRLLFPPLHLSVVVDLENIKLVSAIQP